MRATWRPRYLVPVDARLERDTAIAGRDGGAGRRAGGDGGDGVAGGAGRVPEQPAGVEQKWGSEMRTLGMMVMLLAAAVLLASAAEALPYFAGHDKLCDNPQGASTKRDLEGTHIDVAYHTARPSGYQRAENVATGGGGVAQQWRAQLREQLGHFVRARRAVREDSGRNNACYRELHRLILYLETILQNSSEPDRADLRHVNRLQIRVEDACPQIFGPRP